MKIIIRKAQVEDAKDIVEINNIEWEITYKDLLPKEVFIKRREKTEERIKWFKESIKEKNNKYVAVVDNKVVGFATYGKAKDDEYTTSGQIYACYILEEYHAYGIGRKLIATCMQELINDGYTTMISGCLVGNPFNEFHKSVGGEYVKTIDFDINGYIAKENIYYYPSLKNSLEMNEEKIKNKKR